MAKMDERGSAVQQELYDFACRAFKPYEVVYEYPIGELKQRIDIFIPLLGIAIEYDGRQHSTFTKFFHKDENAWNYAVYLDTAKDKYLYDHGVKLIRIPYDFHIENPEQLRKIIDDTPYPPVEYELIEKDTSYQKLQKLKQKEQKEEYKRKQKEQRKRNSF